MVRPSAWAFFNLRPALLLPLPDRRFIPFQGAARRALATPPHLPQNPPHMARMVPHPTGFSDQVGHAPGRPQACVVPQGFRTSFQPSPELRQGRRTQSRLAPGTPRLLEPFSAALGQLLRPAIHRLAVDPDLPRHLRLRHPLLQQLRPFHPPSLQSSKISSHSCWISHTLTLLSFSMNVTILYDFQ